MTDHAISERGRVQFCWQTKLHLAATKLGPSADIPCNRRRLSEIRSNQLQLIDTHHAQAKLNAMRCKSVALNLYEFLRLPTVLIRFYSLSPMCEPCPPIAISIRPGGKKKFAF